MIAKQRNWCVCVFVFWVCLGYANNKFVYFDGKEKNGEMGGGVWCLDGEEEEEIGNYELYVYGCTWLGC
jgi:hypothetical protein